MARKGDIEKAKVIKKIEDAFGEDFIAFQDKKIYVKAMTEDGEELQFAISVTMPKTGITTTVTVTNPIDANDFTFGDVLERFEPKTLTNSEDMRKKEEENVKKIMERLGI